MSMGRPTDNARRKQRQTLFLNAFAESGVLARATEATGVYAAQHHNWLRTDADYARLFIEIRERTKNISDDHKKAHPRGYRVKGVRALRRAESQEKFLEAFLATGVVTDACKIAGVSASTPYTWRRDDEAFSDKFRNIESKISEQRKESLRERKSKASKNFWSDSDNRKTRGDQLKSQWTPEKRAEFSDRMSVRAQDPEVRVKLSKSARTRWSDPEAAQRQSAKMKAIWESEEHRAKMRERMNSPETKAKSSKAIREQWAAMSADEKNERMRHMRKAFKGGHKLTKIESLTMTALNDRELPYLAHKVIGAYNVDFIVPSLSLIIECDGSYHHAQRPDHDEKRDKFFADNGYATVRLSDKEIESNNWERLDDAINKIK